MSKSRTSSGPQISRARQRYLGLTNYHGSSDAQPPSAIHLTLEVQRQLLAYLYSPNAIRSGPLFGRRQAGVRVITAAGRGVPPGLVQEGSTDLFSLCALYVLGWSDALTEGQSDIDWVGHWLIAADSLLGSYDEHLSWLHEAERAVLLDDNTFLLTLGYEGEGVRHRGWIVEARRPATLSVTLL